MVVAVRLSLLGRLARAALVAVLAAATMSACGGGDSAFTADPNEPETPGQPDAGVPDEPPTIDVEQPPPRLLSELNLLAWDRESEVVVYNDLAVPYELNTPLFSDYTAKSRAIFMPAGSSAAYDPNGVLDFPVGTVIVKTFIFADDLRTPDRDRTIIETRLLRRASSGWEAWPYIWNEDQTDADLKVGGKTLEVSFIDARGEPRTASYLVPQRNQCAKCHDRNVGPDQARILTPIGPEARHLNRDQAFADGVHNQLQYLADRGQLTGLPPLDEVPAAYDFRPVEQGGVDVVPDAELDRAARDYLDINCAYCHDPFGTNGVTSQLFLNHDSDDLFRLGVCKRPGSAGEGNGGLTYNIVPGDPDNSIMVFRVETVENGAIMPVLGRSIRHDVGAALVRRWVAAMDPVDCD